MASLDGLSLLSEALQRTGHGTLIRAQEAVDKRRTRLRLLSDDELKARCQDLLAQRASGEFQSRTGAIRRALWRLFRGIDPADASDLAVGVEVFSRAPADLALGSELYPEQVQAAAGLLDSAILQMDTGEGKTYALLPVAFVLACRYGTVYVLCANQYLAERDAHRTRRFWDFVGIEPGVGHTSHDEREWSRRVVYTTISQLTFKAMQDEWSLFEPAFPVRRGALLMDDADVVLLDELGRHRLTYPISSASFDWSFALTFCDSLVPDEDVVISDQDAVPTARLTLTGEEALRQALGATTTSNAEYLLTRSAVELAYIAKRYVVEGDHYVVNAGQVIAVDRTDGRLRPDWNLSWLPALQALNGERPQPRQIAVHEMEPTVLVKQFMIHSGVSGTVGPDALEYYLGFGMPPVRIPSRFIRHAGESKDVIFRTRAAADQYVAEKVKEMVEAGRPVLVGTQSIADAQACYRRIKEVVGQRANVRLLTAMNEIEEAEIFESAGEVGAVTVATQIAGRGVDIRLSDAARRNGGLVLLGRGHATLIRRDRQFLGRAGRQGDPFDAQFVGSLEDPFMRMFRADAVDAVMRNLNIPESVPIDSAFVTRQIGAGQRQLRTQQIRRRRVRIVLDFVDGQITEEMSGWFHRAQRPAPTEDATESALSAASSSASASADSALRVTPDFVDFLIQKFLDQNVQSMLPRRKPLNRSQAGQLGALIVDILQPPDPDQVRRSLELDYTGRRGRDVRLMVKRSLKIAIDDAHAANERARSRIVEAANEQHRAADNELASIGSFARELRELRAQVRERTVQALPSAEPRAIAAHERPGQPGADGVEPPSAEMLPHETHTDLRSNRVAELRQRGTTLDDLRGIARDPRSAAELSDLEDLLEDVSAAAGAHLAAVRQRHQIAVNAVETAARYRNRSSLSVAHWSLTIGWAAFLADRDRIEVAVRGSDLPYSQQLRVFSDRVLERWQSAESDMTITTLKNLIRAGEPAELDGLYQLADNYAGVQSPPRQRVADWQPRPTDITSSPVYSEDAFIDEFIRHSSVADDDAEATLVRVLRDFLVSAPLSTLQTPLQIHQRMLAWRGDQKLRGIPEARRRRDEKWVHRFVTFLHGRGAVATVPGAATKLRASAQRLRSNLSELRTVLPVLVGVAFAAILYALSQVTVGQPGPLSPWLSLLDGIAGGGLLATGAITGPGIAALALGRGLSLFLSRRADEPIQAGLLAVSGVVFVILATLALVAAWPATGPWPQHLLTTSAAGLGMLAVFYFGFNVLVNLELWSSLRLVPMWLTFSVGFVFLPRVAELSAIPVWTIVPPFAVAAVVFIVMRRLGRADITVTASSPGQTRAAASQQPAVVESAYRVEGTLYFGTYVLAIGLALIAVELLRFGAAAARWSPPAGLDTALLTGFFMVFVLILVVRTIRRRTAAAAWQDRLNRARQTADPQYFGGSLVEMLRAVRRRLIVREVVTQLLVMAILVSVTGNARIPGLPLPVAVLLLVGSALFAVEIRHSAITVYELLVLRAPTAPAVIDMPVFVEKDPDERPSAWARLLRWARRRMGRIVIFLVAVLTLLSRFIDAVEVGDFISRNLGRFL